MKYLPFFEVSRENFILGGVERNRFQVEQGQTKASKSWHMVQELTPPFAPTYRESDDMYVKEYKCDHCGNVKARLFELIATCKH